MPAGVKRARPPAGGHGGGPPPPPPPGQGGGGGGGGGGARGGGGGGAPPPTNLSPNPGGADREGCAAGPSSVLTHTSPSRRSAGRRRGACSRAPYAGPAAWRG